MAGTGEGRPSSPALVVVCHNANGIRDARKRGALFQRLAAFGPRVVALLQETHCDPADDVGGWLSRALGDGRPWGGRAHWAHGRSGSRGVAVCVCVTIGNHITVKPRSSNNEETKEAKNSKGNRVFTTSHPDRAPRPLRSRGLLSNIHDRSQDAAPTYERAREQPGRTEQSTHTSTSRTIGRKRVGKTPAKPTRRHRKSRIKS